MGYHGFGMRKEVYKRKPKQAFEKIKKHNKKNPYGAPKQRDDREVYIHTYHKPAYKRWWFILLALSLIGYFAHSYITTNVLPEYRHDKEVSTFENEGLLNLYLENKPEIDGVFNLMKQSEGTWSSLEHKSDLTQIIRIKSRYINDKRPMKNFSLLLGKQDKYIVSGDLLLNAKNNKAITNYWQVKLAASSAEDIPATFLKHMDIDVAELDEVLKKSHERGWSFEMYPTYRKMRLRKYVGSYYTLFFASSAEKVFEARTNSLTELAPGIYWKKGY